MSFQHPNFNISEPKIYLKKFFLNLQYSVGKKYKISIKTNYKKTAIYEKN